MKSAELRRRFLGFFKDRDHAILPSASLVPENDPTALFNTAGMQPLVPYLMGTKHPKGSRLANFQKCVRTTDIEDIGDKTHATFFEMLGNWSLGDYFKEKAIAWSYEFLTSKSTGLGLDPNRLYVTVFSGDENVAKDMESVEIWVKVGMSKNRIFYKDADSNWWPAVKKTTGDNQTDSGWTGPTGPSTEMFYDVSGDVGDLESIEDFIAAEDSQKIVEIWNDVFMEYEKQNGKLIGRLNQKNVDTGAGFERLLMVMQGVDNIFDIDIFEKIFGEAKKVSSSLRSQRIIADHIRTAVFMIVDGVLPSNTDKGYILRRLLRRAIFLTDEKNLSAEEIVSFVNAVAHTYEEVYPEIKAKSDQITAVITSESEKFKKTLEKGLAMLEKRFSSYPADGKTITGQEIFEFFSTYGFPADLVSDFAKKNNIFIDLAGFDLEMERHQNLSRAGAEQKFKGGLGDTSEMSVKYHTATHLLNAALKKVLGDGVNQKGSNITPERLRFDFSHDAKMTDEQKKAVEDIVNEKITAALPVSFESMSLEKARELGAVGVFGERYPDTVTVYTIGGQNATVGDKSNEIFSREICGGPHVENTQELGRFKIAKEEAVSQGVRRIKATL
ncbi:MAG: alanine--tRNA ligase, partial [Patescibacteria group bacterium]